MSTRDGASGLFNYLQRLHFASNQKGKIHSIKCKLNEKNTEFIVISYSNGKPEPFNNLSA